jgi:signal transduction histidine kinase
MTKSVPFYIKQQEAIIGLLALAALYLASLHDYLLFHSIAELFSTAVAYAIFAIAWNARRFYRNAFILVIGVASIFVGSLGLFHALAYKGMGVFPGDSANPATQFWIAARGLFALSLLTASLLLGRKLKVMALFLSYTLITGLLLCSILVWRIFPICYIDGPGGGLTPIKIWLEYVICLVLLVGLFLLWKKRAEFDPDVFLFLVAAFILSIAAEIAFTCYASVYSRANMLGHIFIIASYYSLYKGIVQVALSRPYDLLFRELKQQHKALLKSRRLQEQMTQFLVHDLRSPLSSIMISLNSLGKGQEGELTPGDRQLADAAIASGIWMLTLLNALLDSARIENGELPVQMQEVTLGELIEWAVEQTAIWARLFRIEVQVEGEGAIRIRTDLELTRRILVNLLSNGLKYSPAGSTVVLRTTLTEEYGINFSITDRGSGIPEEWRDKVFDRFAASEASETGLAGYGLGLSFCKLAVEAQGGRIWLDSEMGKGTTVSFELPQ